MASESSLDSGVLISRAPEINKMSITLSMTSLNPPEDLKQLEELEGSSLQ
jgi:hypothetical protein